MRLGGKGSAGSSSASDRVELGERRRPASRRWRSRALPRKPLVYQAACLRKARSAARSPNHAASSSACSSMTLDDRAERAAGPRARARRRRRRGRGTATAGRGSRARRRRRRSRSRASCAARRTPPRCRRCRAPGSRVTACFSSAIASQSRVAVVELRGGARVQRDGRAALVLADAAGVEEGRAGSSSMPMRNLIVTGTRARVRDRRAHDARAAAAASAGSRRRRRGASPCAPGSRSSGRCGRRGPRRRASAHRLADVAADRRRRAGGCAASRRARSSASRQRLAVALDERARRDHLAHVEAGAEAAAEACGRASS